MMLTYNKSVRLYLIQLLESNIVGIFFEVIKSSTWVSLTFGILIQENMVKAPDAAELARTDTV